MVGSYTYGFTRYPIRPMEHVNTELSRLIAASALHEEDAREITRIFAVLTSERKIEVLRDWDHVANRIRRSRIRLEEEKSILLQRTLENIERDIAEYEKTLNSTNA